MRAIRLTLVVGAVLLSANPAFPHFVKAALGFRLGYSPAEKGYGEKLSLNSGGKKGVGVQLLSGVNQGGWQGGEARASASNTVGDAKASGSTYGYGIAAAPQQVQSQQASATQGRSLGGNGPLEALGSTQGAVRHLKILGLNLYLGGRAAHLGQGLGLVHKPAIAKKPLLGGILAAGGQQHSPVSGLVTGASPLAVLSKPISVGAGVGGKSNFLTNLGPAPNGGRNIGGLHGIRIAAGTPNFGLGLNLGLRHAINSKSPLGQVFGLGGSKYAAPSTIGRIPLIYKGQDQVYIPGAGVLRGHGHDNNVRTPPINHNVIYGHQLDSERTIPLSLEPFQLAYSPNSIEGLESKSQIITAQAPLQLSVIPLQGGAQQSSQINPQAQSSQQHIQQAPAPQQHQHLQGPLSLPSTYRNPFLSFLRPSSLLRPTPLQYTFNHPQAQQTGPIRQIHSHRPNRPHPNHLHQAAAPQRPRAAHPSESHSSPSLFSGWSTLFPLGRHKSASTHANNYFVNPLLPNGQPLAKLQASLRPGQSVPVTSAQRQVPFIQQTQRQQQQQQQQQQLRGYQQPQYSTGYQNILGVQPQQQQQQQNYQQYYSAASGALQRPTTISHAPSVPASQQQTDYNLFQFQPFQNYQTAFQIPQATPFLNGGVQSAQTSAALNTGTQFNHPLNFPAAAPFSTDASPFAPPPGFQYSHSTHSQPVKMGSFTMDLDLGQRNTVEQANPSNNAPLYGPLGRRLKKSKSKTKTRSDVIIKKKDDFVPESSSPSRTKSKNPFTPYSDMETSATNHALNAINSMTLSSSLGETSWTPIINIEFPAVPRKSLNNPVSIIPRSNSPTHPFMSQDSTTAELKKKSFTVSKESTSPSPSKPTDPTTIIPSSPTGSSQDRSKIFRRRKLNLSGEQSSSSTSAQSDATSPSTVVQTPSVSSSSSNSLYANQFSSLAPLPTTVQPPEPSSSSTSDAASSPVSSSLAPSTSTSSIRPSYTTTTTVVESSTSMPTTTPK